MAASRRFSASAQWAIAITVAALGVVGTLLVANAVNHAGWSPWTAALGWAGIVALGTVLVKLRGSPGLGSRAVGPMGDRGGAQPGDGMQAGGG